jgi:hypothetical protein
VFTSRPGSRSRGLTREDQGKKPKDSGKIILTVELGAHERLGRVQGQDLHPQQVVAGGDAGRQGEVDPTVLGDHVVDAPGLGAGVEGVLPDLEPLLPRLVGRRGVSHLGQPRRHGALVRLGDGVVGVVGELRAPDHVLEPRAHLVAGRHRDHLGRGAARLLADYVARRHVVDRVVARRRPERHEGALVRAVHGDFLWKKERWLGNIDLISKLGTYLENAVCIGREAESQRCHNGEPHAVCKRYRRTGIGPRLVSVT